MIAVSLGWGVQSFTLAVMSAFGDLPAIDVAIHSDTTHERSATHRFAEQLTPWLEDHDVRIITVRPNRTLELEEKRVRSFQIPAFTFSPRSRKNNGRGQLRRQCTQRWKIAPLRRWLQTNRGKQTVEMWLGISVDEVERAKPSTVK
jgi:3'-phosphoadenosine 5'-phosphosulfate sulfotransferase (PAPS reductase)/FAD synthetase